MPTLAELVLSPHTHSAADFIADERHKIILQSLAEPAAQPARLAALGGKSVLLALPHQLDMAAALVQLDGVASRLVIWPQDSLNDTVSAVARQAEVDEVITDWPAGGVEQRGTSGRETEAARAQTLPTQWVMFTSGTTGVPKMIVHDLQSLAGHLMASPAAGGGDRVWATFYDIRRYGGMQILLRALAGGGSLVLSCPNEKPGAFLDRAGALGTTHLLGTPSHWRKALMTEQAHSISPAYVRCSGEVADQALLDRLKAIYPAAKVVHAFASTEAGLAFEVEDGLAGFPEAFVGRQESGIQLRVAQGNLWIGSDRISKGRLDGTIMPLGDAYGFVDTGDSVILRDGRYHFMGRADGVVNVGGQKVHPEEIESIIARHPLVQMCRVRSRPNPITGAIVVAEIVRKAPDGPGAMMAEADLAQEIQAFCRAHLEPFKVPARVAMVSELDVGVSGKLVRLNA